MKHENTTFLSRHYDSMFRLHPDSRIIDSFDSHKKKDAHFKHEIDQFIPKNLITNKINQLLFTRIIFENLITFDFHVFLIRTNKSY